MSDNTTEIERITFKYIHNNALHSNILYIMIEMVAYSKEMVLHEIFFSEKIITSLNETRKIKKTEV